MTERRAPYDPQSLSAHDRFTRELTLLFQAWMDEPAFITFNDVRDMIQEAARRAEVTVRVEDTR